MTLEKKYNLALTPASVSVRSGNSEQEREDILAEEVPIALVYNGVSHAVMMATPLDLEDFVIGFSLTEGIIKNRREILDIEIDQVELGIEINVRLLNASFSSLKKRRRAMSGKTGCGLCGIEALEAVVPNLNSLAYAPLPEFDVITKAMEQMSQKQVLNHQCGALHCAALSDKNGDILALREDIGRHNALDKLIGSMQSVPKDSDIILLSSRTSFELVQKAAVAQCRTLVSISAPTALANELCQKANINLIGFVREGRQQIYNQSSELEHSA
jgi:FdhD protein